MQDRGKAENHTHAANGMRVLIAFQKVIFAVSKVLWPAVFAVALLVLILLFVYGVLAPNERSKLRPAEGMNNVEAFAATHFERHCDWVLLDIDGKAFYEARKRLPMWTLPSGEACYIFDEKGRFLDWTPDTGDDPDWKEKWSSSQDPQPISLDEMIDAIRGNT